METSHPTRTPAKPGAAKGIDSSHKLKQPILPKPLVAMIHLPPLPGAGNYGGAPVRTIAQRAVAEARLLSEAGFDALLIQNTHDRPSTTYVPPETLTAMTAVAGAVAAAVSCPLGINVHKNDGPGALAVAHAVGAAFVRVKVLVGATLGPEGIIQGNADAVVQLRNKLQSRIEIWADLGELTSVPLVDISLRVLADWTARFGSADRLIVTESDVTLSAKAVGFAREGAAIPVLIGGRTDPDSICQALAASDGVIVGSYLRADGKTANDLVARRVHELIQAARTGA
jgi:membrane complex biogenesis BtpA family protein